MHFSITSTYINKGLMAEGWMMYYGLKFWETKLL